MWCRDAGALEDSGAGAAGWPGVGRVAAVDCRQAREVQLEAQPVKLCPWTSKLLEVCLLLQTGDEAVEGWEGVNEG